MNTNSFKKIVFKKEAVSNLNNSQMNVVRGGETYPTLCWACTGAVCTGNCANLTGHFDTCPGLTDFSGTSICYDVCY